MHSFFTAFITAICICLLYWSKKYIQFLLKAIHLYNPVQWFELHLSSNHCTALPIVVAYRIFVTIVTVLPPMHLANRFTIYIIYGCDLLGEINMNFVTNTVCLPKCIYFQNCSLRILRHDLNPVPLRQNNIKWFFFIYFKLLFFLIK